MKLPVTFKYLKKRMLFLFTNSSIHGLRFVVQGGNIAWRAFWLLVIVLSGGCLYLLLLPDLSSHVGINFTPDTQYIGWTTTFPAVTVCETFNTKKAQREFIEKFPELMEPLSLNHRRYLTDVVFARGACTRSVCAPCGRDAPVACDVPWRDIVTAIRKTCSELLSDCSFNGVYFTCCSLFHLVDSERGPCYAFNTLQFKNSNSKTLRKVNASTGPGTLTFTVLYDVQISVHSSEELSTNNLDSKLKFDVQTAYAKRLDYLFSVVEMENDPKLETESIDVRNCRYLHEIPNNMLHMYPVYSYGACKLGRNTEHSYKTCGCVHPARDLAYKNLYCNYTGLNCLATYEASKIKLGQENHDEEICLLSCVENDISTINIARTKADEGDQGTVVTVRMSSLPTIRYRRNLLQTNLDAVVSVGGMVALLFSASILSLVEIFYLLLRKN